ncbi:RNB domain-containing ribonuclease [Stomatohabitans albus]|uniref:RNB domain-containing ribonuclease n=1 Tax=Stomatohabitans albus TaxID=3110766 RepID=UPI00300D7C59
MQVTGRYTPHSRGFGFVDVEGGHAVVVDDTGQRHELTSVFVPPAVGSGWIDGDVVTARLEVDDQDRLTANELSLVKRPRRFVVGVIRPFAGKMVLELDSRLGNGEIPMTDAMSDALRHAEGRQVVAMVSNDGRATCTAQVTQPAPVEAPSAIRASAIVIAHGAANASDFPLGVEAVDLDSKLAVRWSLVTLGRMTNGQEGLAGEMSALEGPVPGPAAELIDRRHETCVTIDDDSTQDLDDAISAAWSGDDTDPVLLTVHIADATGTVGIGSTADQYARTMATTSYFASGANMSMLDPKLSEDELSLHAQKDRRAVTVRMLVYPDGTVTGAEVSLSWISPTVRLSYEGVEKWLRTGDLAPLLRPGNTHSAPTGKAGAIKVCMDALEEVSKRLTKNRERRITIDDLFTREEVELRVEDGRIVLKKANKYPGAQQMVETAMVAANEAVASWAIERRIPLLYRSHTGFDPERLETLTKLVKTLKVDVADPDSPSVEEIMQAVADLRAAGNTDDADMLAVVAGSSVGRATYVVEPDGHVAMGSTAYTHFTSPLRRYADLIVHRQVRAHLANEALPYTTDDLEKLAAWLDYRTGGANRTQALERAGLWAVFLPRKTGGLHWPTPAQITELTASGARVRLTRAGIGAFLPAARMLGLPPREKVSLELVERGMATTDGKWHVGQVVDVRMDRLDPRGRPEVRPSNKPAPAIADQGRRSPAHNPS